MYNNIENIPFTVADAIEHERLGYINIKEHPENADIWILNYTNQATYEEFWNDVTLLSRGLIINVKTGEVVARPFPKFFNYGERNYLYPKGNFEATAKLDGSLGIMYRLNDEIRWATRGSFVSDQAKIAQQIWDKKYSHLNEHYLEAVPQSTMLVEIIHPQTRVVVDYQGTEDLILIGGSNRFLGHDYSNDVLAWHSSMTELSYVERLEIRSVEDALELKKTIKANESEGWVFRWEDGYRLKVKGDDYVQMHKIMYGLSDKQTVLRWSEGTLKDMLVNVPEEFRKDIEDMHSFLDHHFEQKMLIINSLFEAIYDEELTEKEYSKRVHDVIKDNEYIGYMFGLSKGKDVTSKVKENIWRNYREILEVFYKNKTKAKLNSEVLV